MGKSSGGTSQTSQTTSLPDWVNNASMGNYQQAQKVSQNLMGPYGGQRVADMPSGMSNLIQQLYGNVGSTNPAFSQAMAGTNALMGYNPQQVTPQSLATTSLTPYMSPYMSSVIDPTIQGMEQQRQQQLNQIGSNATAAGAFGGSRQGVQEGVTNAQTNLAEAQMRGGLLNQGFGQAQAAATGDISRDLTAQQANQQYGLLGAQLQGGMASQLGQLAGAGQQNWLTGLGAAMGGQQQLQQQQQNQLNAAQQYYAEQQQYPLQQLGILQSALGQSPYGQTVQGMQPGPTSNGLMQGLGGLSSLVGMAGTIWGMSDRRLKVDKERVGTDETTGLPLWSFRYKGDPKTYPKVVGPMAQDVEKKFPGQVIDIGKYKAVNMNFLAGMQEAA